MSPKSIITSFTFLFFLLSTSYVKSQDSRNEILSDDDDDDDFDSMFEDDDFFSDDKDDFFSVNEEDLPPCFSLMTWEIEDGVPCNNDSSLIPEVRYQDKIFQRLVRQIWSDYQAMLNNEGMIYGIPIDPMDVDSKLPQPLDIKTVGTGYSADVKMHGIKMYGLSLINLRDCDVTRNENMTDFDISVTFEFDSLGLNGTYSLKGLVAFWKLDSKGEQNFSITMVNATITYRMKFNLSDGNQIFGQTCDETYDGNVLITDLQLRLRYDDIDFRFENLGSFANNVVNSIGMYILRTQEEMLVSKIKDVIKKEVNSLIC